MRKYLNWGALLLASGAASVAVPAQAAVNLVVNGSFELGIDPAGQTQLVDGDITSLTGWRVLAVGVNYADSSAWDAADGTRSVELNGQGQLGGIVQRVFGFNPGRTYRLRYDVSANPFDPNPRPKASRVIASISGGNVDIFTYTLNDINTAGNMLYTTVSYDFVAGNTFRDVQFRSLTTGTYGPVIDAVSITIVPEASTWAMMIAGFALVGAASRRRSRGAVSA